MSIINNIAFEQIENFLTKYTFHCLKSFKFFLKIDALNQSCLNYIDANRWENLLQLLSSLEYFNYYIDIPIESKQIRNTFEQNQYFLQRNWQFSFQIYTYSFNTILRIHTIPYPQRHLVMM